MNQFLSYNFRHLILETKILINFDPKFTFLCYFYEAFTAVCKVCHEKSLVEVLIEFAFFK